MFIIAINFSHCTLRLHKISLFFASCCRVNANTDNNVVRRRESSKFELIFKASYLERKAMTKLLADKRHIFEKTLFLTTEIDCDKDD